VTGARRSRAKKTVGLRGVIDMIGVGQTEEREEIEGREGRGEREEKGGKGAIGAKEGKSIIGMRDSSIRKEEMQVPDMIDSIRMKISKEVLIVIGMIEVKMLIVTMKKQRLMDKISNRKIMSRIIKLRKCKILKIMIRILISKKLIMIKNMEVLIKLVILIKL
jgi:hypothetical protein